MGLFDSVSSLASAASPVTNLLPGGSAINLGISLGSKLGKFLSGGGGAPDHERPDIVSISNQTGLTQKQVENLCGMEEKRSPSNYDDIVKKYAANPAGLLNLVSEWNASHSGSDKIVPLDSIPDYMPTQPTQVPPTVYQSPVLASSFTVPTTVVQAPVSAPVNNLTGTDLKDLGTSILKGGQAGATDWAMQTPAGQQAKKDGFNSWLKDNELYVFAGALALLALIYKAFFSKK
jgi:hypothetical protein